MFRNHDGFTLAELLVSLAIAGIGLALGVPAIGATMDRVRTDTAFNTATTALAYARMAAVTRRVSIVACPSADGLQCRTDGDWGSDWIVRTDPTDRGAGNTVLRRFDAPRNRLVWRSTSGRPYARYLKNGSAHGSNLTLTLCNTTTRERLGAVVVNNAGRTRTDRKRRHTGCTTS